MPDIRHVLRTYPRRMRFLLPPRGEVRRSIADLRRRVQSLPAPSATTEQAAQRWLRDRAEIRECILTRDPRTFLTWPPVLAQMVSVDPAIARHERGEISDEYLLREDAIGAPPLTRYDLRSSVNLIHSVYHLEQFRRRTGRDVGDYETVFEFGGGYGSLCRVIHRAGFSGCYHIFDLPEVSALQEFYLSQVPATRHADIRLHSDASARPTITGTMLFIATWSISETPESLRSQFASLLSEADAFLIAYQDKRGGVDNSAYFSRLADSRPDVEWTQAPIDHIPGSTYLIGVTDPRQPRRPSGDHHQ